MFFRCLLLGMSFALILFIFDILLPKLKLQYRVYKEFKIRKQRQEAFRNKMNKLEIN